MKLGTKLIAYLLGAVIIVMTIHGYLSIQQERENFRRELRVGMRGLTRSVQAALNNIYGDDRNLLAAQEFIDKVGPRGNIHGLIVYNLAGEPIAVSVSLRTKDFPELDPEPVVEMDPSQVLRERRGVDGYLHTSRQLIYYRVEPIFTSDKRLVGAFVLARQGWGISRTIETRRNRIIATAAALILLLSILILIIVRRNISRPIQELIERIREIGEGHWEQRIEVSSRDEVSFLAQEFNRMCERLQDIYSRLAQEQEEKLKLERDLRHSEKLASVGQLAAGLAHEIGTPLNIISGRAENLLRRPRSPEEMNENLHVIRSQIDRIAGIVRQLLEFSRRKEPTFRSVDISSLLVNVKTLLQHKIEEKRVGVETAVSAYLPRIQADPDLLQQVFINLYLNSLYGMKAGGTIKIGAEVTQDRDPLLAKADGGPWLKILFEDNGPGIFPEHMDHVFDPFFTTKDIGEGTGLGLSVTYGIIKDHGGDIRVESEPGHFTRFIIHFPMAPSHGSDRARGVQA